MALWSNSSCKNWQIGLEDRAIESRRQLEKNREVNDQDAWNEKRIGNETSARAHERPLTRESARSNKTQSQALMREEETWFEGCALEREKYREKDVAGRT